MDSMIRNLIRGALLSVLGLLITACLGDLSQEVRIVNDTAYTVTVYPYGQNQPQYSHVLDPGASAQELMLTSDTDAGTYVARVEAVDGSHTLVFCHRYTYGELQQLGWQVHVKHRELRC